ncbi:helix-turn-helix domain-containing protein [Promicromonospora iranensis]|uniref:Transcriptional regulator with XRE-family HTH domain n=1 Tax=Promicromonospora iranensis TaxID=1105144 RepID=A0ABU2CKQ1_9MICO|nr:XRE family transcriptional regulator [Promicromonospora iranensis]MDR7381915.1 transcriptional regulator with XRE-family HTH domain [Promicromonospora iranensis]
MDTSLPARVRQAIEKSGLTQADFATKVRLTPDKLSKSLNGTRRFTTLDLALIAETAGTTVDWLLTGREPERPAMAARASADHATATIESIAERFHRADQQLQQLRGSRELTPVPLELDASGLAKWATGRLAERSLTVQALSTPDLINALDTAFDVDTVVERFPGGLDGFAWQTSTLRLIGAGMTLYWARQRFTIAHELGHILLRHAHDLVAENVGQHGKHPHEKAADKFAAEFLMPETVLRAAAPTGHLVRAEAIRLVNLLQVSPVALSWRARNLGLISPSEQRELAALTAETCSILGRRPELAHQAGTDSAARRFPRRIVVGHLNAYQEGETSARPLADLLSVPVEQIIESFAAGGQSH